MLNRNQVIQNSELSTSQDKKLNKKNRVDINILLNRVRADKKKEKLETLVCWCIISLVSLSVLATGLIVSLIIKINYKRYLFLTYFNFLDV